MSGLETIAPTAVISAGLTLAASAVAGWFKQRADLRKLSSDNAFRTEEHRDSLTFQLLKAAKDEVAAARAEVAMFRPLAQHLAHFEEAINHIERLVAATDNREYTMAQKAANNFLTRMKGMGNLQQMSVSAAAIFTGLTEEPKK